MIGPIIRIQKELTLMLNSPCMDGDEIVDALTDFINKMSPYEIILRENVWVMRHKKTLKEVNL
jgi:hypothetical protein